VLTVVGLNVGIGLLARFIDNAAHLGGLAGGFVLGFVLRPKEPLFPGSSESGGRAAGTAGGRSGRSVRDAGSPG
jgi:hypothetical protein